MCDSPRSQALVLSLVCNEAYGWVIRALYRSLTFVTHAELLRFQKATSSNPELALCTQNLYIGSTQHPPFTHADSKTMRDPKPLQHDPFTWTPSSLTAVRQLLISSPNLSRLALINLPPSLWSSVSPLLPSSLKSLTVGPAYGLPSLTPPHLTSLQHFYYADTSLMSSELIRLASLPSLTEFRWRSPLQFDNIVYGQLKILLESKTLKRMDVILCGTEEEVRKGMWGEMWQELCTSESDRLHIVCDPEWEGRRAWIGEFWDEWKAVEF